MSWDRVAKVTVNEKKRKIEPVDTDVDEMSVRCTDDTLETARRIIEEQIAAARPGAR